MAKAQTKQVTKEELQSSRLSALVHNISMQTSIKDLECLLKRKIGMPLPEICFGKPYEVDGEKRKKAYLNFKNEERVNELMKGGSLIHHGQEMKISRHTPKNCQLPGYITSTVLLKIYGTEQENGFGKELTEYDLKKYFQYFGEIIACDWQSSYEVILEFRDYDSVDRIILHDVSHTISGIKVDAEKTLKKLTTASSAHDARRRCIHVTNIPWDVTSDELSLIFSVHVADILLQPGNPLSSHLVSNDGSTSEAWIKHLSDQRLMQDFIEKYSRKTIRGIKVDFNVVEEPFSTAELCTDFEKGDCRYSADKCNYKHIMCNEPDECENKRCWYGHNRKRSVISDRRPIEDFETSVYRVKLSNLPSKITKEELLKRLNIPLKYIDRVELPDQSVSNKAMVVYLVKQPSENLLRVKIREWHNSSFSKDFPNKMKCQLERNMNYFDWDDHSDSSEILSQSLPITTNFAPWYDGKKDTLSTCIQNEQSNGTNMKLAQMNNSPKITRKKVMKAQESGPSDLAILAPQWRWTNEQFSNDSSNTADVYLLADKTDKELNAAIKVYRTKLNSTAQQNAQREKLALEKLQGLDGIPMFVTSNIDVQSGVESNNQPWIIMKHIQGSTLREFVRLNSMNFRDKLIITIKLLNIVREMHSRNIVHRHINPENIIIPTRSDTEKHHNLHGSDQINLVLIGFSRACLTQDNEANNRMIFEDDPHHIRNTFYKAPQLERQSSMNNENERDKNILCSPGIDTSSVCAVLFWFITGRNPKESKKIKGEAPHQLKARINIIDEELKKATGIWTESEKQKYAPLKQHLQLVFDRAFDLPEKQWSIKELAYQLQHMLQLVTKNNEENSCFPLPLSKKQIESSMTKTKPNSFLQLVSLIDSMKRQFSLRYPVIHWSTDEKSKWVGSNQIVENTDVLTFEKQYRPIVVDIHCRARINNNQELMITIRAKMNENNIITLPIGIWKEYEEENTKEEILKIFELELKILIDILYKKTIM